MKKAAVTLLAFSLLLLTPSLAFAEDSSGSGTNMPGFGIRQDIKNNVNDLRLKSCQARVDSINKRSGQLADRAQNMENVFGQIAVRVENYYTSKIVPAGITVANYDSLVSDIATKKTAVDLALANAKSKATFDCSDLTTVKTKVSDFRSAMQKVIAALKDYRTSVKNLIVAVRGAAGQLKPSPSPSANP